ncbi:hypothetical protein F511_26184 [Dorcoceras hygrometricum]|uniref:Cystatin domain-containing protein n=1 Tax=Dorcoceras hygrometricum TaxID=472368 RepID=A0A2Z6ZVQ6_9LAMI|nr:hypothetical protein F511_45560 [Dorcoceras hygrometricum]KZV16055.1 hypothetical protein F511_26184 [Dorcoceras hygrometricum]
MANKSITLCLVLYVLFGLSIAATTTTFRGLKLIPTDADGPGARFVALDPKDPKVVGLGKFVIHEQNKDANSRLKFDDVIEAAFDGSDGASRYALLVGASDSKGSAEYYAYVLVNQESKELVAFKRKTTSQ